jgi:hypothetical protein
MVELSGAAGGTLVATWVDELDAGVGRLHLAEDDTKHGGAVLVVAESARLRAFVRRPCGRRAGPAARPSSSGPRTSQPEILRGRSGGMRSKTAVRRRLTGAATIKKTTDERLRRSTPV